jgi:hypothetical protein
MSVLQLVICTQSTTALASTEANIATSADVAAVSSSPLQLELVSGFGQAALQHFAAPLLEVLVRFCSSSKHLKHSSEGQWMNVRRIRSGQQQQQHHQQPNGHSQFAGFSFTQGAAAAAGTATAATWWGTQSAAAAAGQDPTQAVTAADAAAATQGASGALHVDSELYQAMLDAKVLAEPKGAASAAWERWQAGESAEQVATAREKPIQVHIHMTAYQAIRTLAAGCMHQR